MCPALYHAVYLQFRAYVSMGVHIYTLCVIRGHLAQGAQVAQGSMLLTLEGLKRVVSLRYSQKYITRYISLVV